MNRPPRGSIGPMRWYSTSASARTGEPSVLAILETLAAMSVSVWIGVYFETWMHVIIGACVAPFMLLRTDAACLRSIRWMTNVLSFFEKQSDRNTLASESVAITLLLALPFISVVVRIASTVTELWQRGGDACASVSGNWWRQALATDSATSPEWIPLPVQAEVPDYPSYLPDNVYDFSEISPVYRFVKSSTKHLIVTNESLNAKMLSMAVALASFVLMVFFAFAYRWSIKSTAIVWFPLLWALRQAKPSDRNWKTHLSIESRLKGPQLIAAFSAITLAALLLKYVLFAAGHTLGTNADAWRQRFASLGWKTGDGTLGEILIDFIRPGAIPVWQIAAALNACLAIFVWWKIRGWLAHYDHNLLPADDSIARTLGATFFVRRLLTSYSIACNGFIFLQAARKLPLPEIGTKLFPWV